MSVLNIERITAGISPDQAYTESVRPFRFSVGQRIGLMDKLCLETHIQTSQRGKHLFPILEYVSYLLQNETGETDHSRSRIQDAAAILPNLGWYEGPHLTGVVSLSGRLLDGINAGKTPLTAGEYAAGALKNAAHFTGSHIAQVVKLAVKYGYSKRTSARINYDCVRTLLYAAKHFKDQLALNDGVRKLLERAAKDENPVIANHAIEAKIKIFG